MVDLAAAIQEMKQELMVLDMHACSCWAHLKCHVKSVHTKSFPFVALYSSHVFLFGRQTRLLSSPRGVLFQLVLKMMLLHQASSLKQCLFRVFFAQICGSVLRRPRCPIFLGGGGVGWQVRITQKMATRGCSRKYISKVRGSDCPPPYKKR